MRILITDDSGFARKTIRAAMMTIFPDAQYFPAGDGQEGYNVYRDRKEKGERPDIVLMDHLMPELDGLEAMEKILAYDPSAFVVFISANIQDPIRERAIEMGAKLFINKPLKTSSLQELKQVWDEAQTFQ